MATLQKIRTIANNTRRWAEKEADKEGFDPETLSCFCARGAAELFRRLKRAGLSPRLAYAYDGDCWAHIYVRCERYLIDITASQFGHPNVVVRHTNDITNEGWYWTEVVNTFESVEDLQRTQEELGWPEEQIAK